MKKSLYFFFGILLICGIYQACAPDVELPGSIYGVVADKATGEPIKSAGVELSPGGLKTITGSEGQFEFTELDPGKYTLLITKTGYLDGVSSTIEVKAGQQAKGDVQIEKLPPSLRVVNDKKEDIDTLDFGFLIDDVARSFNLFNDGVESFEWQITTTAKWIQSVSKTEGVLSAGATQSLILTIDRNLLGSGENTTTLHITSNNGSKQLIVMAVGKSLATLNTLDATNIKTTSATLNGEIITDGSPKYSERGFVYSESPMPSIDNCIKKVTSEHSESKTFSASITGLVQGKSYYVRAYAINEAGEAYSANEIVFVPDFSLPQVATVSVEIMDDSSVYLIGNIIDEGDPEYIERGFVYATMDVTLDNPNVTKVVLSKTSSSQFEKQIVLDDLSENPYYIKAYAKSEIGVTYGEAIKTNPEYVKYILLPTFAYNNTTYRVYPSQGPMSWYQAIEECKAISFGGYNDWFLPNKEELNAMYLWKNSIEGFQEKGYYSSTESNNFYNSVWGQNFGTGSQYDYAQKDVDYIHYVRCIRKEN